MNKQEYYVVDIYDPREVESTLAFAPYLDYELHSVQDVYARSDVYVSLDASGRQSPVAKGEFNGNFAHIVNLDRLPEEENRNVETHITSYTKVVFKRDSAAPAKRRYATQESVWKKFGALLSAIARKAEDADRVAASLNAKKENYGAFIFGTILLFFGAAALVAGLALKNNFGWALYVLYAGIGVAAIGFLLFVGGIIAMAASSSQKNRYRKIIGKCVHDYREVARAKRQYEKSIMTGYLPRIDATWFYNKCLDYGVPYVAPNPPAKK